MHLPPTPPPEFLTQEFHYITTGSTLLPPAQLTPKSGDGTCPICRGSYFGADPNLDSKPLDSETSDSETAVRISCGHIFGHLCIQSWFESHYSCPMCRAEVGELYSYLGTKEGFEIFLETHNQEVSSVLVVECDPAPFSGRGCWVPEYYAVADVEWLEETG